MADFSLDTSSGSTVLRCQVGDCEWKVEQNDGDHPLWDSTPLMQHWLKHVIHVHPDRNL
ncbi:MAG: hypothetical protein QOE09_1687 [Ilumatobacteraceae bacterium]|jgi:hypothetical protein